MENKLSDFYRTTVFIDVFTTASNTIYLQSVLIIPYLRCLYLPSDILPSNPRDQNFMYISDLPWMWYLPLSPCPFSSDCLDGSSIRWISQIIVILNINLYTLSSCCLCLNFAYLFSSYLWNTTIFCMPIFQVYRSSMAWKVTWWLECLKITTRTDICTISIYQNTKYSSATGFIFPQMTTSPDSEDKIRDKTLTPFL